MLAIFAWDVGGRRNTSSNASSGFESGSYLNLYCICIGLHSRPVRAYFTLLRLFYQVQMGPIFGWGFLLGGGSWASARGIWISLAVFLLFHVGACGGATSLNSYYDQDSGPVGGLWKPPEVPRHLLIFAWAIQLGGLVLLVPFGFRLCAIYALTLILSLGYSHPRLRWKADPLKSLLVVCFGQGAFSFAMGALTAQKISTSPLWEARYSGAQLSLTCGVLGVMSFVAAFYPLTQLFQIESDTRRGEQSLASWLQGRFGRNSVFSWAAILFVLGGICNALAVRFSSLVGGVTLQLLFAVVAVVLLVLWRRAVPDQRNDFVQIHRLLRLSACGLGTYMAVQLILAAH
ncbi:hypothetical protein IAD21_04812 [Abditibacteriota bacterium]|nr:hypothetical protein IAD21_04812 [Abditibacteriota bacterium]